jgi:uncharacterized coiled-coil protein SlyX
MQATSLSELEKAIAEARKKCDEATAGECAAAWDTVEELSAAIAHKKAAVSVLAYASAGKVLTVVL